jgi:hypothetical protein
MRDNLRLLLLTFSFLFIGHELTPIAYKIVLSQNIKVGMHLVNIGTISNVELEDSVKLVRLVCKDQFCLSAAYYWYRYNSKLVVQ